MTVSFDRDDVGYTNLAVYVSELVRQGVTFKIEEHTNEVKVTLTGGF